jgi:uncharacterized protein YheU (UPF0270 family)
MKTSHVKQVIQYMEEGRADVVFDLASETCNIVPKHADTESVTNTLTL